MDMGSTAQASLGRSLVVATLLGVAFFLLPGFAHAASLSIAPSVKDVTVGQIFTLSVDVSSPDAAMNAASGDVSFPSDKIQVLSVSKADSVMSLWIRDPSFSNSVDGGDVHFEGVVLNPGFIGADGNLITITFEAIAAGDAPISFSSGAVLANDGNGTNILKNMDSGDVTVAPLPPPVASHVSSAGGSNTSACELPLEPFSLDEVSGQDPTNPQPIFTWQPAGAVSQGIVYMVKIGNGDYFNASTIAVPDVPGEYQLPLQAPTKSTQLTVVAYDPACSSASSSVLFSVAPIPTPSITDFTRTIPSSHQLFSVEGTAATGTTVLIYLEKSNSVLAYSVQTDATGRWSMADEETMSEGTWKLHAQAMDARGALSEATPDYNVQVSGWFNDLFTNVTQWGIILLILILLLGAIVFLAMLILHSIRKWRVSSNEEVLELENRLRNDLRRIEKELDSREAIGKRHKKEDG